MKINRILPILLIAGLFLAGCQAEEPASTSAVEPAPARATLVEGNLAPRLYTDLAFPSAGRVVEVLVAEGDAVTAGQVLARLELLNAEARQLDLARAGQELLAAQQASDTLQDPKAAAQRIAQAKYDLANLAQQIAALQEDLDAENDRIEPDTLVVTRLQAQIELLKAQSESLQAGLDQLGASGIDPEAQKAAETRLVTAQAALEAAQAALHPVELKAPWDGTIASLNLVVGQMVTAGLPVATLADFSSWVVITDNLTEIEVVGVEVGQTVNMILDALPDVNLSGTVEAIRPKFEEKRGDITYTVMITLDSLDAQARWGMTAAIRLER